MSESKLYCIGGSGGSGGSAGGGAGGYVNPPEEDVTVFCPKCGTKKETTKRDIKDGGIICSGAVSVDDPDLHESFQSGPGFFNNVLRKNYVTCDNCNRNFRKTDLDG